MIPQAALSSSLGNMQVGCLQPMWLCPAMCWHALGCASKHNVVHCAQLSCPWHCCVGKDSVTLSEVQCDWMHNRYATRWPSVLSCNSCRMQVKKHQRYAAQAQLKPCLHADAITCCKVSRAGRHAASGGMHGELKLWGLAEGAQLDRQQHAHAGPVTVVVFLEPAVVSAIQCGAKSGGSCRGLARPQPVCRNDCWVPSTVSAGAEGCRNGWVPFQVAVLLSAHSRASSKKYLLKV